MSMAGSIIQTGSSILSIAFKILKFGIIIFGIIMFSIYVYKQFSKIKEEKKMNKFCLDNNITRDDLDKILESEE